MEEKIMTDQRIYVLDLALPDTPARWWDTHKALIMEWKDATNPSNVDSKVGIN